jgi:16S rRNA G966 N2-methylase RsmD
LKALEQEYTGKVKCVFIDPPYICRVLEICTTSGDLVLDSFAGSGTTGAVAHKMGRCRIITASRSKTCHKSRLNLDSCFSLTWREKDDGKENTGPT